MIPGSWGKWKLSSYLALQRQTCDDPDSWAKKRIFFFNFLQSFAKDGIVETKLVPGSWEEREEDGTVKKAYGMYSKLIAILKNKKKSCTNPFIALLFSKVHPWLRLHYSFKSERDMYTCIENHFLRFEKN